MGLIVFVWLIRGIRVLVLRRYFVWIGIEVAFGWCLVWGLLQLNCQMYVVKKLELFLSTSLPAGLSVTSLVRKKKLHLSVSECLDLRIGALGV
jgi:hypothetical protein